MANENWEEINMWEVEEDVELSQRISVCVVRPKISGNGNNSNDDTDDIEDSEYQLIQTQKHPTYAAAAKLGNNNNNSTEGDNKKNKKKNKKNDKMTTVDIKENLNEEGKLSKSMS